MLFYAYEIAVFSPLAAFTPSLAFSRASFDAAAGPGRHDNWYQREERAH